MLDPEKLDEYMKNPKNTDKCIREIAVTSVLFNKLVQF